MGDRARMSTGSRRGFFDVFEDEEEEGGQPDKKGEREDADPGGASVDNPSPEATIKSEIRQSGKDVNRNSG